MPETPLEGERTVRMIRAADVMLVQLYAPPAPPSPPRGGPGKTCQPVPAPSVAEPDEDDFDINNWRENLDTKVDDMTRVYAADLGFWPDGAPFDAGEDDWQTHARPPMTEDEAEADRRNSDPPFAILMSKLMSRVAG